jgi:hypothetical protein
VNERMGNRIKLGLLAAVISFGAAPLFAQTCPLCYTQAASSGARLIAALRSVILVLTIPPMFMSAGITWLAYRKRRRSRQDANTQSAEKDSFDD